MADAAIEKKDAAVTEEVTSTEVTKESPVKKSPAKKAAEVETNGKVENGSGDAPEETPAENGDNDDESNDATENGDSEKKETGVKRKSVATEDNGDKTTPEKKAKVADEAPPTEPEEAKA